jgi:hypothetical protein
MAGDGSYDANADAQLAAGYSSTGNSAADEVSNQTGGGYNQSDASKETDASQGETSHAWHDARDAHEKDSGEDRHSSSWRR